MADELELNLRHGQFVIPLEMKRLTGVENIEAIFGIRNRNLQDREVND